MILTILNIDFSFDSQLKLKNITMKISSTFIYLWYKYIYIYLIILISSQYLNLCNIIFIKHNVCTPGCKNFEQI